MITKPKPTVLFIHGAWHQPVHFEPVRKVFEEAGYETVCPAEATISALPPIALIEDAKIMRDELTRLVIEECKEVVVVGHSWGGHVMTEAVHEDLGVRQRREKGEDGGVVHLVYMCAFIMEIGVTKTELFGGRKPPWCIYYENGQMFPDDPAAIFYHDLPEDQQKLWISHLVKIPAKAQEVSCTNAAYLYHPATYLYCRNDRGMPLFLQEMMVKNIEEKTGIKLRVEHCDASHSPFLSMPERVLEVVENLKFE